LPEAQRRCWRFYSALPNLGIDVYPERMDFFQVLPTARAGASFAAPCLGLPDERRECRDPLLSSRIKHAGEQPKTSGSVAG